MLEKLDHGHHVLRIYCKSLVARTYEKFGTFLRVEVCVNRLKDLGLNKGLEQLPALREKLIAVTDRLAGVEADLLNVHVDFPLFERLAKPVAAGRTTMPGIKIHDTRMLRLMEVLLHGGSQLAGWRTAQLHTAVREAFGITPAAYSLSMTCGHQCRGHAQSRTRLQHGVDASNAVSVLASGSGYYSCIVRGVQQGERVSPGMGDRPIMWGCSRRRRV